MQLEAKNNQRTIQQNKAMHLYFRLLAEALNDAGYDMKKTLKPTIDIPWSPETIKEYLWRPVLNGYRLKTSTAEMSKTDIDTIYDIVNKTIGERTGVFIPFPSIENLYE